MKKWHTLLPLITTNCCSASDCTVEYRIRSSVMYNLQNTTEILSLINRWKKKKESPTSKAIVTLFHQKSDMLPETCPHEGLTMASGWHCSRCIISIPTCAYPNIRHCSQLIRICYTATPQNLWWKVSNKCSEAHMQTRSCISILTNIGIYICFWKTLAASSNSE